ncbi:hypothetical protein ACOMHN_035174 [Nucella lapillus]
MKICEEASSSSSSWGKQELFDDENEEQLDNEVKTKKSMGEKEREKGKKGEVGKKETREDERKEGMETDKMKEVAEGETYPQNHLDCQQPKQLKLYGQALWTNYLQQIGLSELQAHQSWTTEAIPNYAVELDILMEVQRIFALERNALADFRREMKGLPITSRMKRRFDLRLMDRKKVHLQSLIVRTQKKLEVCCMKIFVCLV